MVNPGALVFWQVFVFSPTPYALKRLQNHRYKYTNI